MDVQAEDSRRVDALLKLEQIRIETLGIAAYALQLQELADAGKIPVETLLEPFREIISANPQLFTTAPHKTTSRQQVLQISLLKDGEVRALADMESEIIRFAVAYYRGQMSETARRLKLGRSTLYRKLDEANQVEKTA